MSLGRLLWWGVWRPHPRRRSLRSIRLFLWWDLLLPQFLQVVLQYLRPRPHLVRQNDGILVHWDLSLLRYPLSQPSLVLLQCLLEGINLSMGI